MKKQTVSTTPVTSNQEAKLVHYSDGSELIPSEISLDFQSDNTLILGYTRDDEGIINNYAVEPGMSVATYPTPKQQLRYIFWGAGAIALVSTSLLIALAVS
ncbi:conserved hypothetical protein (plasmid) [Gloeothece citriformis PCC 7424]|uniref:Ssl1498 family light-harvesting-like protein n=1 Tax=Gloeothece citriformis (strain PCC 7424) TaxID=65393 RepID=B7KMV8_GLOC7|nr:ssl1498 family light-harvesting-like protein [Gloeothece citriformis]ACK74130.1 conserved hypothetical protein [Gloeothece citriformis PCC 7424]